MTEHWHEIYENAEAARLAYLEVEAQRLADLVRQRRLKDPRSDEAHCYILSETT